MSKTKNSKATMKTVLSNLELQQYLPTFQKHNIDLKIFLTMNEQTLQSVGVLNETHRRILVICIRRLSQLLATVNLIEELDEHLLTPITEEAPEILSDDASYRSSDFIIPDEKSDKCVLDPPPAYTVEPPPQEMSMGILSPTKPLTSKNAKSNNPSFGRRLSLLIHGSGTSEDIDSRNSNRRHSMPELPSYLDAVKGKGCTTSINLSERECEEELPSYSCTVNRAGYLIKKDETKANGQKASDRSWRKFYVHLWGTFVRIYKSEPLDINHVPPILQFSMNKAIVGYAVDYTKRRNVLRVYLPTGHRYLFHAINRADCISWIESLQSSANISSTIDDREMPMFITLPVRRRRRASAPSSADQSGAYSFMTVTSSGLTQQHFNEIARELQQVQVTDVLPGQQLLW